MAEKAWAVVTVAGNTYSPRGGVELVEDVAGGGLLSVEWEQQDEHDQPDGTRHRWRSVVPASAIERIIYDLGTVDAGT